jgi:hypothetical protein
LLFTQRDGTPVHIRTPDSLADEFRHDRARVAVEAVPLFERALARLIDRYAKSPPPAGGPH